MLWAIHAPSWPLIHLRIRGESQSKPTRWKHTDQRKALAILLDMLISLLWGQYFLFFWMWIPGYSAVVSLSVPAHSTATARSSHQGHRLSDKHHQGSMPGRKHHKHDLQESSSTSAAGFPVNQHANINVPVTTTVGITHWLIVAILKCNSW